MNREKLGGRRILVVEDEVMVAMLVEDVLADEDCIVIGPIGDIDDAMAAARDEPLDMAVLDINVGGRMVFPVAEILAGRGVPFLLLSGYGPAALPKGRHWPICSKPFKIDVLVARLQALIPKEGLPLSQAT